MACRVSASDLEVVRRARRIVSVGVVIAVDVKTDGRGEVSGTEI
jgi:transposase-like protein